MLFINVGIYHHVHVHSTYTFTSAEVHHCQCVTKVTNTTNKHNYATQLLNIITK